MPPSISNSLYVAFGAALAHFRIPRIRLQTERQKSSGVRVTDVMLSVAGAAPRRGLAVPAEPRFECSVYVVWKTRKN